MVEMASPCGWVLAGPKTLGLGRAQDLLDATAESRCGFTLRLPNRLEHAQNMFGVDRVDRLVADGFGVNGQRHRPLRFVLIVAEAVGEICGDRIGHLAERR